MDMQPKAPFVLLDDARQGGAPARLYAGPVEVVETCEAGQVAATLDRVRAGIRRGLHAAGFLSYEAGAAFEPTITAVAPTTPLVWFGLFDGWTTPPPPPDPAGAWIGAPRPLIEREDYEDQVRAILRLIAAGDLYQANLSFRAAVRIVGDPLAVYTRLRRAAGAGYGAVIETGKDTLISLSPELFFSLHGDRLTCRPMKGTARRGATPSADATLAAALALDAKQRAENLMIVDLMRNDLSRVAVAGSVAVPDLFAVETYPTVHQLVSTVVATLAPDRDAVDVLAAAFPCGSITGAPKVRAMQAIAETERAPRGAYTGAIGHIDPDGTAMFNVAIRTLTIAGGDDVATLSLGAGIVADSDPAAEWEECLAKGAFVGEGHVSFDLIETMAFDPEEGMPLLERHLARMKASAEVFGFAFDRHGARNELQAATFRLRDPCRIRLLLAPSGSVAVEMSPLPPAPRDGWTVAIVPLPVSPHDLRLRHKTSDRGFYDEARRAAATDEVLFEHDGVLTEGSFTSLFVERDGVLLTPPPGPLLPGVLVADLIAAGRARPATLTRADLTDGFFVGNALRGLIPAIVAVA
ncbi:aminodeoxychorismate synthase component I [Microvirga sp. SRT01]|uniref:Probable branched-chain-amino-acid aminotransferase n=1 Tax=Sphingomonas longa TaxID=2778730 RepID=A0ABS2D667_9SPHN|nr:aminodeoxychorismate synthase component I [Microvirga sp. SRT01]MBM6576414.1 aminodeoxychorismate synthase component I [Sphingomonas sp. BT552]MBR7709460.1 aminodeoxychorismate synthase component I [Microvirga sp. SRT01]